MFAQPAGGYAWAPLVAPLVAPPAALPDNKAKLVRNQESLDFGWTGQSLFSTQNPK